MPVRDVRVAGNQSALYTVINQLAAAVLELKTDYNAAVTLINELKTDYNLLLAKLDDDAGVTDTDYEATLAVAATNAATISASTDTVRVVW